MIKDPYQVLGISPGAAPDEIKRAYRQKAKEYHPDLHPNDPVAAQKMNEVNEAYDMLQNPEKYKAKQKQESRRQQYSQQYGYNQQSTNSQNGRYQSCGGWTSDFGGFDFGDIFGFGAAQYNTAPQPMSGDSAELVRAIRAIQNRQYEEAVAILSNVTSNYRNDRWYYLNSYAYNGLGDMARAQNLIEKAIQMKPENRIYRQLYREISQNVRNESASYRSSTTSSPFGFIRKIIIGIIAFRLLSMLPRLLFYGFGMCFAH